MYEVGTLPCHEGCPLSRLLKVTMGAFYNKKQFTWQGSTPTTQKRIVLELKCEFIYKTGINYYDESI